MPIRQKYRMQDARHHVGRDGARTFRCGTAQAVPRVATEPAHGLKQLGWTDRGERTLKGDKAAPVRVIVSEKVATQSSAPLTPSRGSAGRGSRK